MKYLLDLPIVSSDVEKEGWVIGAPFGPIYPLSRVKCWLEMSNEIIEW